MDLILRQLALADILVTSGPIKIRLLQSAASVQHAVISLGGGRQRTAVSAALINTNKTKGKFPLSH